MRGFAVYPFPFGFVKIEYAGETVIGLKRTEVSESGGRTNALTDLVYEQIMEYMQGKRKSFDFPHELHGTEFQKRVWSELCRIPYGETRTYKEIASAVGNPNASRAVGMANHANPIAIAVPCHRVIGTDGSLTGYGGGLDMKEALLSLEKTGCMQLHEKWK